MPGSRAAETEDEFSEGLIATTGSGLANVGAGACLGSSVDAEVVRTTG